MLTKLFFIIYSFFMRVKNGFPLDEAEALIESFKVNEVLSIMKVDAHNTHNNVCPFPFMLAECIRHI